MQYDCLIVDDEQALAAATAEYFGLFGVSAAVAESAAACRAFLAANTASLILLDVNLGDGSGFALCREIRAASEVPVLFVSARTDDDDVLAGLGIGGDDYIKKPYTLSILLAKVKAVLRRCLPSCETLVSGALRLDVADSRAYLAGEALELKTMEFKLLCYFVRHPDRVLSKEELFRGVWGDSFSGDGTLNVHIRRLREKIEEDAGRPRRIRTVWGVGYRYHAE